MKVIVCVDNDYGIAFNHRRQSRDRVLTEQIIEMTKARLLTTPYSSSLLEKHPALIVSENPLADAQTDDFVFAEKLSLVDYVGKINTLILYHGNRTYPSDHKLDLDLSDFRLLSREEFVGYSHDKITKEIYVK